MNADEEKIRDELYDRYLAVRDELDKELDAENIDNLEHMMIRNDLTSFVLNGFVVMPKLPSPEAEDWILKSWVAAIKEMVEAVDGMSWKWWGRGSNEFNREYVLEELVDAQHFIFNMLEAMGVNSKEFHEAYVRKNNINWERFEKRIGWGKVLKCMDGDCTLVHDHDEDHCGICGCLLVADTVGNSEVHLCIDCCEQII